MDSMDGIDFQDSFVLGWSISETELSIELEASIWPSSVYYQPPKLNEYTCYKRATIAFTGYSSIVGLIAQKDVQPSKDLDGSLDYGNIDSFSKTNNGFVISGSFGNVTINSGKVVFSVGT